MDVGDIPACLPTLLMQSVIEDTGAIEALNDMNTSRKHRCDKIILIVAFLCAEEEATMQWLQQYNNYGGPFNDMAKVIEPPHLRVRTLEVYNFLAPT